MKDMKWLYNMVITFFAAGCLTACSDYLEVDSNFKDRLTIEKVFTDKMTFIVRIGIMREMVNIPMVVIILFSEMWNTMKIGIRILIKRVI